MKIMIPMDINLKKLFLKLSLARTDNREANNNSSRACSSDNETIVSSGLVNTFTVPMNKEYTEGQ